MALAALFLTIPAMTGAAGAASLGNGKFDLGISGGVAKHQSEITTPLRSTKNDLSGNAYGVFARYTVPVSNDGVFVGLHASWQKETADTEASGVFPGAGLQMFPAVMEIQAARIAREEGEISRADHTLFAGSEFKWSADLLLRVGYDSDVFAPYIAGGVSLLAIESVVAISGDDDMAADGSTRRGLNGRDVDEQTHIGWKVALGVDVNLTDNLIAFVQGEYAKYSEKDYAFTIENVTRSLKAGTNSRTLRVGLGYRF